MVKQDKDATREFYGRMVPFRTSLTGKVEAPKMRSRSLMYWPSGPKKLPTKTSRQKNTKPVDTPKPVEQQN